MDRHAGAIISDPSVALVELIANAWDAYATQVHISWPAPDVGRSFSIRDNGVGMTAEEFEHRWGTLDYDRASSQGTKVSPPPELEGHTPRPAFGRNGRGRHAAFHFSSPYEVRTWRDGTEVTYRVSRGSEAPFERTLVGKREGVEGHGTEIRGTEPQAVGLTAAAAREVVGTRFLTDPQFLVKVDGTAVNSDDISEALKTSRVEIEGLGTADVFMVDAQRSDRTTKQHGIAWRVQRRLVGECRWRGSDVATILDGRTSEAKRYTFIVFADFLADADAVKPDWSDFDPQSDAWNRARPIIQEHIRQMLSDLSAERRKETKEALHGRLDGRVRDLSPRGRERWSAFIDRVVDDCPSISPEETERLAIILANLECATSKYGLITKLRELPPGDLDQLHGLLADWTVQTAKTALDEIQSRLKLIREMHDKLRDERADEVQDLQPLFERSLWVFGPEFESIEYTSNQGMSEVIKRLLGKKAKGSRNRPDFVIVPDGSIGLYSCPSFGGDHEADGVGHLVIVELKRPGVPIRSQQMEQARGYVKELLRHGHVKKETRTSCFVLGSQLDPLETEPLHQGNSTARAMTFDTFITRAERRMLNLHERLSEAPFLRNHGLDAGTFVAPEQPLQPELLTATEPENA